MKKPLALVAALLVLAPALAFAAPASAGKIYWTNWNGAVGRANLNGTHVAPGFIAGAETFFDVAVDAAHVYWTRGRGIGRSNLNGGALDLGFITGGARTYGVAVDGAHVYWASGNAIGRADLDGMGVDQGYVTHAHDPTEVAVDSEHIYWTHRWIGRANLDGTGVERRFITRTGVPCALTVSARHVDWSYRNAIGRAKLNGTHVDKRFITGVGQALRGCGQRPARLLDQPSGSPEDRTREAERHARGQALHHRRGQARGAGGRVRVAADPRRDAGRPLRFPCKAP